MKKYFTLLLLLFFTVIAFSQGVGIGTNTPNANAMLDIKHGSKGILVPRMDSVARKNIPATKGLLVYDSSFSSYWYNNGNVWVNMPPAGKNNGDLLYWNGLSWISLPPGQAGQYLSLAAGSLTPVWANVSINPGNGSNISTAGASNIGTASVTTGGSISADNGAAFTIRGVVWSTSPNPTTALSTKTDDGSGIGNYVSSITGLTPATTYYVRAYATSANGTVYGNQVSFATVSNFAVGQTYGGGVIFYVDATGQHGLIAAASDQSRTLSWDNYDGADPELVGNTGVAIGTGAANTTTVINSLGNSSYAATACRLYYNGGGYTDWYLPSLYELLQMYAQRNVIGGFTENGAENMPYYWTSSETDRYQAWIVDMAASAPNQAMYYKNNSACVRAIRAF
ncbi:MAG: DUF1566 domain-containing protein [Ferruginibacter sp.]